METSADLIQRGGQVWNSEPGGRHTSTQMGSGHYSAEGPRRAAYFDGCMHFSEEKNRVVDPLHFPTRSTNPGCYDISDTIEGKHWLGVGFYYGGPGGPDCNKKKLNPFGWEWDLNLNLCQAHLK